MSRIPSAVLLLPAAVLCGCLSVEPPLSIRSFTLVAESTPADLHVPSSVTLGHVEPGIERRMAWLDPRTGEIGHYEAWRFVEEPAKQLARMLALELAPGTPEVTLDVAALWEERGAGPQARLAFRLGLPGQPGFEFDERQALASGGPEALAGALRDLTARAREALAESAQP